LKKKIETSESYIEQLEDKIVQLSMKHKNLSSNFNQYEKENKLLLGKLTHNLKNHIGVIYSFSEMMLENIENYNPEKLIKYSNVIYNSAEYSLDLLSAFAKAVSLKSDDFKLTVKYQSFHEFINDIVTDVKKKHTDYNILLNTNAPISLKLNFDYFELKIAIENIINNAIRYSTSDTNINILVSTNEQELILSIGDGGIGIEPQYISKVFDEFFVVNTYDVHQKKCLGLGLTIAKKIISLHKGSIKIKSESNKGAIVLIKLPTKKV